MNAMRATSRGSTTLRPTCRSTLVRPAPAFGLLPPSQRLLAFPLASAAVPPSSGSLGGSASPYSSSPSTPYTTTNAKISPVTPTTGGGSGLGNTGSGGSGGSGGRGDDLSGKVPPPPGGFSWGQIVFFAALIAAVAVSPLPRWIQETWFHQPVSHKTPEQLAKETSSKAKAGAKDASNKLTSGVSAATEKVKETVSSITHSVKDEAKGGSQALAAKVEHAESNLVQNVKGAAAKVGQVLHVIPDRAKEAGDAAAKEANKAAKEAGKAADRAAKEAKKKAEQAKKQIAKETGNDEQKKWLAYSGIGLAVVAVGAVVAEEVLRNSKGGKGGPKLPKKPAAPASTTPANKGTAPPPSSQLHNTTVAGGPHA